MATYGGYETVGRIFAIGARSVYSAREADGGRKDEYVVKILACDEVFGEDPGVVKRLFTSRAEVQVRLGQARARAWVGAYAQGAQGDEVFYVTDRVPNSAQQLIAGKVRLSHADLLRIVSRVIEGLRELRSTCQRAHLNLKPSNVLIESSGDIATSRVYLTDPSGAAEAAGPTAEHDDVRAIGDLIHQLVLMTPFRAMGGYPIADSPNWARLGKAGEQWRSLCNRLLDPAAAPGSISVEAIAGEIGQFKGDKGGGKMLPLAIGAVALVLLAGGGFAAWKMLGAGGGGGGGSGGGGGGGGPVPITFDAGAWARWCRASRWAVEMRALLTNRKAALGGDDYLSRRLLPLADDQVELRPSGFVISIRDPARAADNPPPDARQAKVVQGTAAAVGWIDAVDLVLGDDQWPAARALSEAADRLDALQLPRFASAARQRLADHRRLVQTTIEGIDGERTPESVAPVLESIARVATEGAAYADLLDAIEKVAPAPAAQAPPLRQKANLLLTRGALTEHEVRELAQFIREHPEQMIAVVPPPDPNDNQQNNQQPVPVVDIGPDPRRDPAWDLAARLDEAKARLAEPWVAELRGDGATRSLGDARAAAGEVDALLRGDLSLEWSEANRDRIRDAMSRAGERLGVMVSSISSARETYQAQLLAQQQQQQSAAEAAQARAQFVQEFEAFTPAGLRSEFLGSEWQRLRGQTIEQYAEPAQLAQLREAKAGLEREIGLAEASLPMPPEIADGPSGFDAPTISAALVNLREREMRDVWQAGLDSEFGPAFTARAEQGAASLTTAYAAARQFARDMAAAESAMTALRAWDEPLGGASGETLSAIAARWQASPLPPEIASAMGRVPAQLNALGERIAAAQAAEGRDALTAIATDASQPLQASLVAWQRLPEDTGFGLVQEQAIVTALRRAIGSIPDRSTADRLLGAVSAEAAARWQRAIERATTRQDYTTVLASREALAPDLPDLSPRSFFNVQLLGSLARVEQLGPTASDADLRAALQRVLDLADQNRAVWQGDSATTAWLGQVRAALSQQSSGPDLSSVGPAASGAWQYDAGSSTPSRAVYRMTAGGSETLEFARLDPGDGIAQPVYLSTTEVSVRLFNAAAGASGLWARLVPAWGGKLESDWVGPRTWQYSSPGGLTPNSKWLFVEGTDSNSVRDAFAPAARPAPPSDSLPVQQITGDAAQIFARGLGCRLPTSAEWRAARSRVETGAGWNLRDQTWQAQQAYVRQRRAQSGNPPPYPDDGAFVPDARFDDIPTAADATASPSSDGILFFAPVEGGAGATFKNLVGNVAEYVNDAPGGGPPRFGVIGGSALSPPELSTDELLSFDNYFSNSDTFSDVGFRLAFDAGASAGGGPTLSQQVGGLIAALSLVQP